MRPAIQSPPANGSPGTSSPSTRPAIAQLAQEDPGCLPAFTPPEPFTATSADGAWSLPGVLLKPSDFDPGRRYPLLDAIYGAPQVSRVPSSLTGGGGFERALFGHAQALADLGFLVMLFDGRGVTGRSRDFRQLSYGRLETAGFLEDHVAAIRQLAAKRPYLDLDRVGIFGSSGGGYATVQALTHYPDLFKVGVAACGNYDIRAYLSVWGETFHGPVGEADYAKCDAALHVHRLRGRLLLAHGELDDNVHPAQTLRLADALIKANKRFDMLIVPGAHHALGGNPYFARACQSYLLTHLMGAKLPSETAYVPVATPSADAPADGETDVGPDQLRRGPGGS